LAGSLLSASPFRVSRRRGALTKGTQAGIAEAPDSNNRCHTLEAIVWKAYLHSTDAGPIDAHG